MSKTLFFNHIISFLLIIARIVPLYQKHITVKYNKNLEIYIIIAGEGKHQYPTQINLSKTFSFFTGFPTSATPGYMIETEHAGEKLILEESSNLVKIGRNIIDPFYYFVLNQDITVKGNHFVGFGYTVNNNTKYSLVHMLYEQKLIDKLSFSLTVKDPTEGYLGKLVIGDFPEELHLGKDSGRVKINPESVNWEFSVTSVGTNLGNFQKKYPAFFDFNIAGTYVPKEFYIFLKNVFLKSYFDRQLCQEVKVESTSFFYCDLTVQLNYKILKLEIGDGTINVPINFFFNCDNKDCSSLFKYNPKYENNWVFGDDALMLFDISFDFKEQQVILYSDIVDIVRKKEEYFMPKYYSEFIKLLFMVLDGVLFLMILVNFGMMAQQDDEKEKN